MISEAFLEILRCPISRRRLQLADAVVVERANREIAAGRLTNRAGETVQEPLDGALVDEDRVWLYAIRDEIPCLLADEAVEFKQLDTSSTPSE